MMITLSFWQVVVCVAVVTVALVGAFYIGANNQRTARRMRERVWAEIKEKTGRLGG